MAVKRVEHSGVPQKEAQTQADKHRTKAEVVLTRERERKKDTIGAQTDEESGGGVRYLVDEVLAVELHVPLRLHGVNSL